MTTVQHGLISHRGSPVTAPLRLEARVLSLTTKHPFLIARGGSREFRSVWVTVTDSEGHEGWGEAAPTAYYGETPETVLAALDRYAQVLTHDPFDLEENERRMLATLGGNASARVAVSCALHDLAAKRLGIPLHRWWGLDASKAPMSTFTIGLDTAERMRAKVLEAAEYPILKVKLGTDRDVEILRTLRESTDREIRVDANCAWTVKQTLRMLPLLEEFRVTVLEQPLEPWNLDGLETIRRAAEIPVIADESCRTAVDIPPLVGKVDGINIKLAKCGSLREALRMIAIARAHGMMVMVGCMIESSLGITAAAHLTPLVDIVDLDGAALLADDPFSGASIAGGRVKLPVGPGLGVSPR